MNYKVNHRYSLALFNASTESGVLEKVAGDAQDLINLLGSEHELNLFFHSPVIKSEKKISVVESFFKSKINYLTLDFIKLLILRNREGMIVGILKEFLALKDDREGILNLNIKTAVKLEKETADKFKLKFDEYTNLNCRSKFEVDEKIIGGFKVQFKDIVFDASLKRQLEILKNKFVERT